MATETVGGVLSQEQIADYEAQGFLILRGVFTPEECDTYRQRIIDFETGAETLEGFAIQENYRRTFNQHLYDSVCEGWMIDGRLQKPLEDLVGGRVEGIQTMHFFCGSVHSRHQDQHYLPECLAAWIPFEDVSERNGTIFVEPGSHLKRLVTKQDVPKPEGMEYMEHQETIYFPEVEKVSQENGIDPVLVEIERGDVCIFHGRTIHAGVKPTEPDSTRHVLACHYIPYDSGRWDRGWPRVSFDGSQRVRYVNADGDVITE